MVKKLIVIPAYNEEKSLVTTVHNIQEYAPEYDYIVVNDCSTDHTLEICRENGFRVINLPVNLGIGGAVQTGYLFALRKGYDIAVQMDGDGQHDPRYLKTMETKLIQEQADMVIGSRFILREGFQSSELRRVGIRFFTGLIRLLFHQTITDSTSGMRMCNRDIIELFVKDYPRDYPEPETVCRLIRKNRKVLEVAVKMKERTAGTSSISFRRSVYYMIKVSLAILIERLR